MIDVALPQMVQISETPRIHVVCALFDALSELYPAPKPESPQWIPCSTNLP
jgi:hypothetical protein